MPTEQPETLETLLARVVDDGARRAAGLPGDAARILWDGLAAVARHLAAEPPAPVLRAPAAVRLARWLADDMPSLPPLDRPVPVRRITAPDGTVLEVVVGCDGLPPVLACGVLGRYGPVSEITGVWRDVADGTTIRVAPVIRGRKRVHWLSVGEGSWPLSTDAVAPWLRDMPAAATGVAVAATLAKASTADDGRRPIARLLLANRRGYGSRRIRQFKFDRTALPALDRALAGTGHGLPSSVSEAARGFLRRLPAGIEQLVVRVDEPVESPHLHSVLRAVPSVVPPDGEGALPLGPERPARLHHALLSEVLGACAQVRGLDLEYVWLTVSDAEGAVAALAVLGVAGTIVRPVTLFTVTRDRRHFADAGALLDVHVSTSYGEGTMDVLPGAAVCVLPGDVALVARADDPTRVVALLGRRPYRYVHVANQVKTATIHALTGLPTAAGRLDRDHVLRGALARALAAPPDERPGVLGVDISMEK